MKEVTLLSKETVQCSLYGRQYKMLILKRKPTNVADRSAVANYREDVVVGHVPFNLASSISNFLKRDTNKALPR